MKEYLKISDFISGLVSNHDGELLDDQGFVADCDGSTSGKGDCIAHAINSHDDLVAEVGRLRGLELGISQLERLKKACTNMGISTPESMEDLGISQHHYIRMLINAAIDM